MCGRYLLHADPDLVARAFGLDEFSQTGRDLGGGDFRPRYNIAPSQRVPIVRNRSEGRRLTIVRRADGTAERELVAVRCGLIPSWARDPAIGDKMINVRAETVSEKPAFRAASRSRRCVVPTSGFYEWARPGLARSAGRSRAVPPRRPPRASARARD
jgi:putative SOS response-associated peptidase YedK